MSGLLSAATDFRAPDDLAELDQWVLWRFETRGEKSTKVPYQPNGKAASTTDPTTWSPFDLVIETLRCYPRKYTGVGYVFAKKDGMAGIDLDGALEELGGVKPWARGIVERFADTYMEVSPSGQGLKIWARGSLPANIGGVKIGDGSIEMYDHARYFAVTGQVFRGAPLQIEEHASDLLLLYERLTAGRRAWPLQPLAGGRIPHGRQHNTLVSLCGTLRARGVCEEAIEACLQIVNVNQCERPGVPKDINRIVKSSRNWGARS